MVAKVQSHDLWSLVKGRPQIDPTDLAQAIEAQASEEELDFRSRLLIRDSVEALRRYWGDRRLVEWLANCPARATIEAIRCEDLGDAGFPSLAVRIMKKTEPEEIQRFLRELGGHLHQPVRLEVGGSSALILTGYVNRATEDVDVVDEVPAPVRSLHTVLNELNRLYGLRLAHFQSHYLPQGWQMRLHSLGEFGRLQVWLVDVYDVFLSKLFSSRAKDREDLRVLTSQLDRESLIRRLRDTTGSLQSDPSMKAKAENNWYILFGEALPT